MLRETQSDFQISRTKNLEFFPYKPNLKISAPKPKEKGKKFRLKSSSKSERERASERAIT
jgi:hypothetical protein